MTRHSTRLWRAATVALAMAATAVAAQTTPPPQQPPVQQQPPPPPTPPVTSTTPRQTPPVTSTTPRPQNPIVTATTPVAQLPEGLPPFNEWVAALKVEATGKGVSAATFDKVFGSLAPDLTVLAKEQTQPELTQTLEDYVAARLTQKNKDAAANATVTYGPLLARIHEHYGVSMPIMVAIWAMESNFGQIQGTRLIVPSLATLAYASKRQTLFRGELIQALLIIDRGLVGEDDMKGSWAGAMGQPQFMPSTFLKFAVDFDGDGKPDIWKTPADVLASMANYLKMAGWTDGETWGREVKISPDVLTAIDDAVPKRTTGCRARKDMTEARPLSDWATLGVTELDGTTLARTDQAASLVRGTKRYFLVFRNYGALLDYNCSNLYAVSVGLLADTVPDKAGSRP